MPLHTIICENISVKGTQNACQYIQKACQFLHLYTANSPWKEEAITIHKIVSTFVSQSVWTSAGKLLLQKPAKD